MHARNSLSMSFLLSTAAIAGCAMYVNIPPQPGDLARHDPNLENVFYVEKQAMQAVLDEQPPHGPYQLILPEGTVPITYDAIAAQLEPQADWSSEGPIENHAQIHVSKVRIRSWRAQVDIVRPSDPEILEGPAQLVTVYLKWDPLAGWNVNRYRPWSLPLDEAMVRRHAEAQATLP